MQKKYWFSDSLTQIYMNHPPLNCSTGFSTVTINPAIDISKLKNILVSYDDLLGNDCRIIWSSTEISSTNSWNRHLYSDSDGVSSGNYNKTHGFSVRCLKDWLRPDIHDNDRLFKLINQPRIHSNAKWYARWFVTLVIKIIQIKNTRWTECERESVIEIPS